MKEQPFDPTSRCIALHTEAFRFRQTPVSSCFAFSGCDTIIRESISGYARICHHCLIQGPTRRINFCCLWSLYGPTIFLYNKLTLSLILDYDFLNCKICSYKPQLDSREPLLDSGSQQTNISQHSLELVYIGNLSLW